MPTGGDLSNPVVAYVVMVFLGGGPQGVLDASQILDSRWMLVCGGGVCIAVLAGESRRRKISQSPDGKRHALPSMVLRVRVEGCSGVICVKLSGSSIRLSRCKGVTGCQFPWCGLVRNCGWYCQGGNRLLSCCHLSQVDSSACACLGGGRPKSVGACVVKQ